MRVLFITQRLHPNYYDALRALSRKHALTVLVATGGHDNEKCTGLSVETYRASFLSLWVERLMALRGKRKVVYCYRFVSARYMFTKLRRERPDVIYMRCGHAFGGNVVAILARFLGIRLVFFSQAILDPEKKYDHDTIYINYLSRKDTDVLLPNYIPHCIDISNQHPIAAPVSRADAPLRLIAVGKPIERKGGFLLIEAISLLRRRKLYVSADVYCGYTAQNADKYLTALQEKICQLGLEELVRLMPLIPPEAMPGIYAKYDLFVHPGWVRSNLDPHDVVTFRMNGKSGTSLYSLLEAMRAGLPVLTSSDMRIVGAIEHAKNGLVFQKGNVSDLADKIACLASMDLAALGRYSRFLVETYYNAALFPKKFENMLDWAKQMHSLGLGSFCSGSKRECVTL